MQAVLLDKQKHSKICFSETLAWQAVYPVCGPTGIVQTLTSPVWFWSKGRQWRALAILLWPSYLMWLNSLFLQLNFSSHAIFYFWSFSIQHWPFYQFTLPPVFLSGFEVFPCYVFFLINTAPFQAVFPVCEYVKELSKLSFQCLLICKGNPLFMRLACFCWAYD